jgi:hypothetical protein
VTVHVLLEHLPLALDGESATNSDTGLAVISIVSMVFGYLLLAGLWYFVFSEKARARRRGRRGAD